MKAMIIKSTGERIAVKPKNGSDFSLEELKDAIGGGYIETVPLANGWIMVCDEDGRRKELPLNNVATSMYASDFIVGDVLVCRRNQIK